MNPKFTIEEALKVGWEKMKTSFWFFAAMFIIFFIVFGVLGQLSESGNGAVELIATILSAVLQVIVGIGIIKVTLQVLDGIKPTYESFKTDWLTVGRYIGASILYGIMVFVGLILLIVPGIYLAIRYQFVQYLIIDKKMPIGQAFKESAAMTVGVKWKLLGFTILLGLINVLGMLLLGIGLLVSIPVTLLAYIFVYRKLANQELPAQTPSQVAA